MAFDLSNLMFRMLRPGVASFAHNDESIREGPELNILLNASSIDAHLLFL